MWLTRLAVRRPITVLMALSSLVVLGAISLVRLPLDFLPQAEFPFIGVQVPYANGIPSQVERDIARPIEEVLATLGGVQRIRSESGTDGCFVGVEFAWGRDVDLLRLEVKEKIDQIRGELPADVRDIFLFTFDTADIPVVEGRISARDRDLSESYDLIEQRVINRLSRVPGVGRVSVHGVEPADVTVYLHLDRIKEHRVDVGALFDQLGQSSLDMTVGQVEVDGLRFAVRAGAPVPSWEALASMPLGDGDLVLGDVADIDYGTPVLPYGRFLNLEPAVALEIQKSSEANTVEVVGRIREELDRINADPALEGIDVLMFFDQGAQIEHSIRSLLTSGVVGSVLAIVVLYFFLRNLATTLIVAMAIPISIIGTCTYLYFQGHSLNVLSMMGLMLGVGMLIDNAVVVLEAIVARMQRGESALRATLRGTREVGRAVVSATLTSIVVFAPIVLGGGDELIVWLREVGVAISVTLIFSLIVSLTIIPVMTAHLLRNRGKIRPNAVVERWTDRYVKVLEWTAIRHPWITSWAIVPGLLALTVGVAMVTGFSPELSDEGGVRTEYMQVGYEFSDDVDYRVARATAEKVQTLLWEKQDRYDFRYLYTWYMDGYAMHRLYFQEEQLSDDHLQRYRAMLREDLPTLAGVKFRLGDDDGGGGGAKTFSVTVHGEDSQLLRDFGDEVKRRLLLVDGVEDASTDVERGSQEVRVEVDGERARRHGLDPTQIAQVMGITFRGVLLPRLRTPEREIDLWVMLREEDRRSLEDLSALTVGVENGAEITLDQVAELQLGRAASRIRRVDQRTAVTVTASYAGEEFDDALSRVESTMSSLALPAGYGWNFGERIQRSRKQQSDLGINALLALICVYMIMASLFESFRHPTVVMSCVPFALVGVLWMLMTTGTPFGIMAMIGIVILIGIVVNNGIVLVDHINHHRRHGMDLDEAIRRGGRERFRPIFMTATTTVLGLVPLALGGSHVGDADMFPMARALMGGLMSSTLLTLLLLPTYYRQGEILQSAAGRLWGRIRRWSPRWRRRSALLGRTPAG